MSIITTRRHDTSHALIHLTGNRGNVTALNALISILHEGQIRGSGKSGFIKGNQKASCFTEMPLSSISEFVSLSKKTNHPYEYYGITLHKQLGWQRGLRPVIYLPDDEAYWIPIDERWRHVRQDNSVDFSHEREWRAKGDFVLTGIGFYVIVPDVLDERAIRTGLSEIALQHICGFLHMNTLNQFI